MLSNRQLHLDWIEKEWDRIAQIFASFAHGHTTASVALKRLIASGPNNHFYRATRELGRFFKTEFLLEYLSQPELRKRIRKGYRYLIHYNSRRRHTLHSEDGIRRRDSAHTCSI